MTDAFNFSAQQMDAMDALFAFCEAMNKGLSTNDLADVMRASIASGHDRLAIDLAMASHALRLALADH